MSDFDQEILDNALTAYNDWKSNEFDRGYSWEICYRRFYNAIKFYTDGNYDDQTVDGLALNLAFYLASWGMYRGSSFILQRDYRIHIEAVEIILKYVHEQSELLAMDCADFGKVKPKITGLVDELKKYYACVKADVGNMDYDEDNTATDTLITKILLGTLGCAPAYDQYVKTAIRENKDVLGCTNDKFYGDRTSFDKVVQYYRQNAALYGDRQRLKGIFYISDGENENIPYPDMKIMDMGLWHIGFEKERVLGIWDKVKNDSFKEKELEDAVKETYVYLQNNSKYESFEKNSNDIADKILKGRGKVSRKNDYMKRFYDNTYTYSFCENIKDRNYLENHNVEYVLDPLISE